MFPLMKMMITMGEGERGEGRPGGICKSTRSSLTRKAYYLALALSGYLIQCQFFAAATHITYSYHPESIYARTLCNNNLT